MNWRSSVLTPDLPCDSKEGQDTKILNNELLRYITVTVSTLQKD